MENASEMSFMCVSRQLLRVAVISKLRAMSNIISGTTDIHVLSGTDVYNNFICCALSYSPPGQVLSSILLP